MREAEEVVYRLRNRADTARWGAALGARLHAGDLVALIGDMGVGKTTLTQALAHGMGVRDPVTSPTFTLVQEYAGPIPLIHCDPYRLDRPEEMADLGFDEYLEGGGVVVVEWADKLLDLLPEARIELLLEIEADAAGDVGEEAPRLLTARGKGERSQTLLMTLSELPEIDALRLPLGKTG